MTSFSSNFSGNLARAWQYALVSVDGTSTSSWARCAIILLTTLWQVLSVSSTCDKNANKVINGSNNRFLYLIFSSDIACLITDSGNSSLKGKPKL